MVTRNRCSTFRWPQEQIVPTCCCHHRLNSPLRTWKTSSFFIHIEPDHRLKLQWTSHLFQTLLHDLGDEIEREPHVTLQCWPGFIIHHCSPWLHECLHFLTAKIAVICLLWEHGLRQNRVTWRGLCLLSCYSLIWQSFGLRAGALFRACEL